MISKIESYDFLGIDVYLSTLSFTNFKIILIDVNLNAIIEL